MEFDNGRPIYIQIMDYLKKKIISGQIAIGDKLDSVRELSIDLKVNPNTIQRAYQELEREGLVFTQRGLGTYVTEEEKVVKDLRDEIAHFLVIDFLKEVREFGFKDEEIYKIVEDEIRREKSEKSSGN